MKKALQPEYDTVLAHCIVCGGEKIRHLVTDFRGTNIFKCSCGMRFMNPQYSDSYLQRYYANYYEGGGLSPDIEKAMINVHDFYLSLIEKSCKAKTGLLLDIGTGQGYHMQAAEARGWKVMGYEIDKSLAYHISKQIGLPIVSGEFSTLQFAEKFDLVTMHQVLEHLKNPRSYLLRVRDILHDGGIFFVAVPNIKSFSCMTKELLEKTRIKRSDIGKHYDSDHHVGYYSPHVLKTFLRNIGFEIVLVRNGHFAEPNCSWAKSLINTYLLEHLYSKSNFLIVARKCT